jgi:cellulose synthase/poly-beta-1,6-N-acetylglucosamine synthase-like glycosyltransferase
MWVAITQTMPTSSLPRITLVTPSFNQVRFLEPCLRSILDQQYPDLEYMVMDGGSTDGSAEVIRRYAPRLKSWRSRPDGGQYAAVAEGLNAASGEVMGWLNSDDLHLPWTLRTVGEIFAERPEVDWITSRMPLLVSESSALVAAKRLEGFNGRAFFRGRNLPVVHGFYTCFIQQESTFWRRSLWERSGGFGAGLDLAGDFDLWARFWRHATLHAVNVPLACFRLQSDQKTARRMTDYMDEAASVLRREKIRPPSRVEILARRALRQLPPPVQRRLPEGIAYTARIIESTDLDGRTPQWRVTNERFI